MYSGIKNASIPNSIYLSVDSICNVSLQIVQVFFSQRKHTLCGIYVMDTNRF